MRTRRGREGEGGLGNHRDPNIGDGQEKGEERQFVDKNQSFFRPLCTFFVPSMAPPTTHWCRGGIDAMFLTNILWLWSSVFFTELISVSVSNMFLEFDNRQHGYFLYSSTRSIGALKVRGN